MLCRGTDGWTDGQTDGQTDGRIDAGDGKAPSVLGPLGKNVPERGAYPKISVLTLQSVIL